jgi:recombination associated protein RdgC
LKEEDVFKNVMIYRLPADWSASLQQVEQALDKRRFVECGATQLQSVGWVAPRGVAHGLLAEAIDGQWILKLMIEKKVLPGAVVKRALEQRVQQIELETGRKPGKKQSRDIKDELMLDLLPKAFTKQETVLVWIDKAKHLLITNAGSQAKADVAMTALVEALPGFAPALLQTAASASASMAQWLSSGEAPAGFSIDRDCELKAADESKATVRYARHLLDIDEVRSHISAGKQPTKLAMSWNDRVSFLLTDAAQLKRISFLDVVFEGVAHKDDAFDADAAIATGELRRLLPELIDALGGEQAQAA